MSNCTNIEHDLGRERAENRAPARVLDACVDASWMDRNAVNEQY